MAKYKFLSFSLPTGNANPLNDTGLSAVDFRVSSGDQSNVTIRSFTSMVTRTLSPSGKHTVSKESTEPRVRGGSLVGFSTPSMYTQPRTENKYMQELRDQMHYNTHFYNALGNKCTKC